MTVDDAIKIMARSVERDLCDQVRKVLMQKVEPIVNDAALAIARQIRTRLHASFNPRTQSIDTYVVIDGVQAAVVDEKNVG